MFEDCLIEREYASIPAKAEAYSGFGSIPDDAEDLLLLLRLFSPGDLAFVSLVMQKPDSEPLTQFPYRVINDLVSAPSTRPFTINRSDISKWEEFAVSMKASSAWNSNWFEVSRRSFLYGGSTEFNANFTSEVDRVMDYTTALEAALVPESDFVSRRLKERAVKILDLSEDAARPNKKLLNEFYGIRSTLVHGGSLSDDQLAALRDRDRWLRFEQIVRDLLIAAVLKVPAEDQGRRSYLAQLFDPDAKVRSEKLVEDFKAIKDMQARRSLLDDLRKLA
jgi:hypothetical protein